MNNEIINNELLNKPGKKSQKIIIVRRKKY